MVGLKPELHQSLPARVLRRAAPARRHRPRTGARSPKLIICDEPVSALDVSIQAQVAQPARASFRRSTGTAYLFIAHDLSRGPAHLRPHRRHVPGQHDGGTRTGKSALRRRRTTRTLQSLLSAVPVPGPGRAGHAQAHHPRGRPALADRRAVRLPLPHALPHGAARCAPAERP